MFLLCFTASAFTIAIGVITFHWVCLYRELLCRCVCFCLSEMSFYIASQESFHNLYRQHNAMQQMTTQSKIGKLGIMALNDYHIHASIYMKLQWISYCYCGTCGTKKKIFGESVYFCAEQYKNAVQSDLILLTLNC